MIIVGLTGGIASGKSTVSRFLREAGAPVVDADAIVHEVQAPHTPLLAAIAAEFGSGVIRLDGSLDRAGLGRIVFADPERRRVLEGLVHPAVRERMWAEVERHRQDGCRAVVLDIPLLIENGLYAQVDQVWLVYVDRQTQRLRLLSRDALTPQEAEQRLAAQMEIEAKLPYATRIIDNRGSKAETQAQVLAAWKQL